MQPESAAIQMPKQLSRLWRSIFRRGKATDQASEQELPDELAANIVPPVDISPGDPILAYFQSSTGVVEIDRIALDSPALREMKEAGVKRVVP